MYGIKPRSSGADPRRVYNVNRHESVDGRVVVTRVATLKDHNEADLLVRYCEAARDSDTAFINVWDRGSDGIKDHRRVWWCMESIPVFTSIEDYLDALEKLERDRPC